MATHFTEHQQQAIDDSHQNILVSASAGSGKTSVLVERVIQKLLHHENIDELLVVTFTDAAAKGMRDRIAKALRKTIDSTDDDQLKAHLKIQINRLAVADISTLHSFCLHLIKQYYYVIDLDPQFRLMTDETEKQLLREGVWNEVREDFYAQNNDVFERLTQNFSNDRSDDGLTEVVQKVDEFANATPDPEKWLNGLVKSYQLDAASLVETSLYQQQLLPIFMEILTQAQVDLKSACDIASGDEAFDKVKNVLELELAHVTEIISSVQTESWDKTYDLLNTFEFATFRGPSKSKYPEASEEFPAIKKLRNDAKDAVVNLTAMFFLQKETDVKNVTRETEILIAKLVEVVKAYRLAFAAEKQRKHALDFNDLEHFAYQILTDQSPEGIAVVEQLKAHYSEVMVDEYQDTNQLQESILQQVVSDDPGNMFMVGDVKQSIYQFRQADPSLFMGKYEKYRQSDNNDGEAIVLAENFRSVSNVINFTNLIFEQLMDSKVGEMEYDDDAHLKFGAKADYDVNNDKATEVLFYESDAVDDEDWPSDDIKVDRLDKSIGEVVMIGQRIQQMIQNKEMIFDRAKGEERAIRYGDIAILVSSRTNNPIIEEQFALLGIPVTLGGSENYFQATEIRIMMSLMRIIDNPYQDIPLVAVLRSPIVGLDENELAYLRIQNKTDQYYQALQEFGRRTDITDDFGQQLHEKISKFLSQLASFKQIAKQNRLVDLIWSIFEETGFLDYVGGMPGGRQRQANLHALYNRAHDYEKSSFKGIFQFVRFINQMQKNDQDLAEAQTQVDTNTVNVMTIHGSKGLEFPVVILMNTTGQFNKSDFQKAPFILDLYKGIGVTYLSPQRIKIDTIQKQLLKDDKNRKNQAEEMRLLYVALTRAEQRLIISGKGPNAGKKIEGWEKAFQSNKLALPSAPRLQANNFMQWIGMALVRHPKFDKTLLSRLQMSLPELSNNQAKFEFKVVTESDLGINETPIAEEIRPETLIDSSTRITDEQQSKIVKLLSYQYPNQAATKTTAYQSVSEIKRLFDDPDNHELIQLDLSAGDKKRGRYTEIELGKPQFLQAAKLPSAAEIGTATHLIFQLLDLKTTPTIADVERLIHQLIVAKTIPELVANKISRDSIIEFYQSEFGQQVIDNQATLKRETPFSLLLPARQLFEDLKDSDEEILIHGIIDGYFKTDDEITIFDYKTDEVNDNIDELIDKYRGQVNLYSEALSRIEQLPVGHKYLYLLSINQLVEL